MSDKFCSLNLKLRLKTQDYDRAVALLSYCMIMTLLFSFTVFFFHGCVLAALLTDFATEAVRLHS